MHDRARNAELATCAKPATRVCSSRFGIGRELGRESARGADRGSDREPIAKPIANYILGMHLRMHPFFADDFIDGLDHLPPGDPLNDRKLVVRVEIVLERDGTLAKVGILAPSGVMTFDVGALAAIDRAKPFAEVPRELLSTDGRAYVHWELHRDDQRCSHALAVPYWRPSPP